MPRNDGVSAEEEDQAAYLVALGWLTYAVHELPAGVLYTHNAATPAECEDLMEGLHEFEQLCRRMGVDQQVFIDQCRWHFDHYPHYLGRRRHFSSYEQYVLDRGGPRRVKAPVRDSGMVPPTPTNRARDAGNG